MTVQEAITAAEVLLPGEAAPEGEIDPRWQAIIAVGEFIETEPEAVWSFVLRWGSSPDEDLRMAIATCLLEHLLEYHFDDFISRIEQGVQADRIFGETVASCWKFGQSADTDRADRFDRLVGSIRQSPDKQPTDRVSGSLAMLRYVELKTGYKDNGPAWIGRVQVSRSGRTVYFNGKAFKRTTRGASGNYYDIENGNEYWISGVKKRGQDRHWAGSGKIIVEASAVEDYLQVTGAKKLDSSRFVVSHDIKPTDPAKFHDVENQPFSSPDSQA
jgi:hypothetical protein